jgi:ribosomal protein S27E
MSVKGTVKCYVCGTRVRTELRPLEDNPDFWFYEVICPGCGEELESVVKVDE